MQDLLQILNQVQEQWGKETVAAIVKEIEAKNLIFKDNLRQSIKSELVNDEINFSMTEYGKFQDEGVNGLRSAYTTAFQFSGDPVKIRKMGGALKDWADQKGLNAWATAWSIQRKGLEPKHFYKSVIESRLDDLTEKLGEAQKTYLDSLIQNKQQT